MVGDPEQISAVAARSRAEAEHVRWLARRVLGAGDTAWHSPAAHVFRARVAERAHALRRCAMDLDSAAHRVEVHAQAVSVAPAEPSGVAALGARLAAAWVRE